MTTHFQLIPATGQYQCNNCRSSFSRPDICNNLAMAFCGMLRCPNCGWPHVCPHSNPLCTATLDPSPEDDDDSGVRLL
jgi:hypothetical protein